MGWNTELLTWVVFNRKTYRTRDSVRDDLFEARKEKQRVIDKIRSLVVTTEPHKMLHCKDIEGEPVSPLEVLEDTFDRYMEELQEAVIEEEKLATLDMVWDECHDENGKPIAPPEGVDFISSYIIGDFIHD